MPDAARPQTLLGATSRLPRPLQLASCTGELPLQRPIPLAELLEAPFGTPLELHARGRLLLQGQEARDEVPHGVVASGRLGGLTVPLLVFGGGTELVTCRCRYMWFRHIRVCEWSDLQVNPPSTIRAAGAQQDSTALPIRQVMHSKRVGVDVLGMHANLPESVFHESAPCVDREVTRWRVRGWTRSSRMHTTCAAVDWRRCERAGRHQLRLHGLVAIHCAIRNIVSATS
mmetsp:Transcript_30412/g.87134  ORF Transcript_30412/g.87134 Transcript_30412/m.87134 type:complete len:229 (+) Transcript_30412:506-1192(+)